MQVVEQQEISFENQVIGAIFLDPTLYDQCRLRANDFLSPQSRILFSAFEQLAAKDKPINPVSVLETLGAEKVQAIGGTGFISQIANHVPTTADFEYYVDKVREARVIQDGAAVMRKALLNPSREAYAETAATLDQLTTENASSETTVADDYQDLYTYLVTSTDRIRGVTTGSIDLDAYMGGLQDGNLIVLAAQTSVGKTAFACHMALAAAESGASVSFFETEMSRKELYQRLISNRGRVDMQQWLKTHHEFTDNKLSELSGVIDKLYRLPIDVSENPSLTINDVRAGIRRSLKEHPDGKHLVVVDYLQNMNSTNRFSNRRDLEVGEITKMLKQTARKFNVPILLLSQLSRSVNTRDDKRPTKSDLRDSGNIEQDADVILMLYREKYYDRGAKNDEIEIIVAKQRNGMTGTVKMRADLKHQKFENIAVM